MKVFHLYSTTGFSNNVYGEIKHPFVKQIIRQTNLKSDHVFLDMVVLFIKVLGEWDW